MIEDRVAKYVEAVLLFDPSKVIIGRENFIQKEYTTDRIYVDQLAPAQNTGRRQIFDDDNETMIYETQYNQVFTLDFVGANTRTNSNNFVNLQSSERAYTSQKEQNIRVLLSNNINNIKDQNGKKYYDRVQLELLVQYSEQTQIDEMRFETANIDLLIDK